MHCRCACTSGIAHEILGGARFQQFEHFVFFAAADLDWYRVVSLSGVIALVLFFSITREEQGGKTPGRRERPLGAAARGLLFKSCSAAAALPDSHKAGRASKTYAARTTSSAERCCCASEIWLPLNCDSDTVQRLVFGQVCCIQWS